MIWLFLFLPIAGWSNKFLSYNSIRFRKFTAKTISSRQHGISKNKMHNIFKKVEIEKWNKINVVSWRNLNTCVIFTHKLLLNTSINIYLYKEMCLYQCRCRRRCKRHHPSYIFMKCLKFSYRRVCKIARICAKEQSHLFPTLCPFIRSCVHYLKL